nr:Hok/Gef family protein [Erwinia amylovora]
MVCMTILAFTLLTRHSLYELRIRDGSREVAAVTACQSHQ